MKSYIFVFQKEESMKKIFLYLAFFLSISNLTSQEAYRSPLNIPTVLSANFGELRPNHFHSGIDFKTQGVINKPVYSIADGYISRISVSSSGYGLALYVIHPSTGHESVYGHLENFAPKIKEYVILKQNKNENFRIDLKLEPNQFPVSKGELIAYSGNTGSSGGPHVHFEVRDVSTQLALDVIPFYKDEIKDTKPPCVRGIALYPADEEGCINGRTDAYRQIIRKNKNGGYTPVKKVSAWGKIGIGVYANDYMDNTNNIYGIKSIKLYCDEKPVFSSEISTVDFRTSKMINSMVDYHHWYKTKEFYVKSFIEPGNKLKYFNTTNDGWVVIDEEKVYKLRYDLEDVHGNKSSYSFEIEGKRQDIPTSRKCGLFMSWNKNNYYINSDFNLIVPAFALYDDLCFNLIKKETEGYYSDFFTVNDVYVPLNTKALLKVKIKVDTLAEKSKYGLVVIDGRKPVWVGGTYKDGFVAANITKLGHVYAVAADTKAPEIIPLASEKWETTKVIRIKATDDLSGVVYYRGTINGKYALFEHDMKSPIYVYHFDASRLNKGKNVLEFTVVDAAGNKSTYKTEFLY